MIKFKDLSGCLKWAIVLAWIGGAFNVIGFLYGFVLGLKW